MITVYGRANSSNVRKVLWTLDELGLAFDRIDYGRGYTSTDSDDYRAINPTGLVPAIRDGDLTVGESNTIIRYLLRRQGAHTLLPPENAKCAAVEQWMDWQSSEMVRPFRVLFLGGHLDMPPLNTAPEQARALDEASRFMAVLDAKLARTGGYVMGSHLTGADLAVGVYVHRWYALDIVRPELAALAGYYDRLKERPAYKANVANGLP